MRRIAFGDYCTFIVGCFLDVEVQDLGINVVDFFYFFVGSIDLPCHTFQNEHFNRNLQNSGFASDVVFNYCIRIGDAK